ncbi:DUF3667 domain-containing protein [Hymenobacter metallilatus]|uniref:DUF3667 domain-containing protein n=1 Tax=Hymenobacter metallilatus TaxID=2493666 RepID=A0A428JGA5_9BACT|nr:DUF3667 domain-containing protein [Hymenobacter metallilatus]RSK31757.1 DUF3667 domain-containing protein [Hymenobacter metallilatus]
MQTLTQPLPSHVSDAPALASEPVAPHICLNCDSPVPDRYCGHCGQDALHTHRLTMADMPHDVLHSIWHVDKGILYTLKTMVRRPGPTIRAYLAGKRVDHFRPLSLLFLVTGVYALVCSVLHIQFLPPRDPAIPEAVWQMQQTSTTFFMKYLSWFYVAMVPVWALMARWFLRRGGYNYAECLIIAAFITAICNFFALLYVPVLYRYSGTPHIGTASVLFILPVVAYATWAYGSLLAHTSLSLARRMWCGFMTYMLGYLVCVLAIVCTTYALNWSTFKEAMRQQVKQQMEQQARAAKATAPTPQ